jgi:glycosyltransferase involved in cell wall biosynthesis
MRINVVSHKNGVGLQQDSELVMGLLKHHDVVFVETSDQWGNVRNNFNEIRQADVNIYLELAPRQMMTKAKCNILIPNPEWWWDMRQISKFDYILTKTIDATRIFKKYHPCTSYIGFTSRDMLDDNIKKDRWYLHSAGKSSAKGSDIVYNTWCENRDLRTLIFMKHGDYQQYTAQIDNIAPCFGRMEDVNYKKLFNRCRYHVCPSLYEGYGHYIWEAMSAKAVVLTTDAPPMNEFIHDRKCLVRVASSGKKNGRDNANLGMFYRVNSTYLGQVAAMIDTQSDDQLDEIGRNNRAKWEMSDKVFRTNFVNLIDKL